MEASALTHASRRGLLARPAPFLRLQNDDRLVALIREGQDRAFEVLFNRYHTRLLAFCQHMLSCREDAEDVLQEVFVAAHNAMLADERDINVRPWLYRIARNRCLNHLRRPVPEGQDSMDIHPHENGATTLEKVQNREEFRQLISDVRTLPETQRTALLLREIDALSYEEIAQAMNNTVPSVKSLLVRARITLAEASQARLLTCGEVQVELAEVAEGLRKVSGPVRQHIRGCDECSEFRSQLRSNSKALAAILPIGPLAALKGLLVAKFGGAAGGGASSAAGGGAAAGQTAAGAGAALSGATAAGGTAGGVGGAIGGALGAKAAAGVATAALLTAGAVEVNHYVAPQPVQEPAAVRAQAPPTPRPVPERGPQTITASREDPAPQPAPADESAQPEPQLPAEQQHPVEQPPAPAVPATGEDAAAEEETSTTEPSVTGTGTEAGEGTVPVVETTGGTPPGPDVPTDPIPVQPSP
jgi:RNA polymerase sigma factor (sigma-70 family)